MDRIVLFRYHNNLEACKSRLAFLQRFNPNIRIFGLYGGEEEDFGNYEMQLSIFLTGNYCLKGKDSFWKWENGDLAIREWFMDYGKEIDFRALIVSEWDLVFFDTIDNIYNEVPLESLALSGLTELRRIENKWFWVKDPEQRKKWEALLEFVRVKYNYNSEPLACIFPGAHISKTFLERYANTEISELCHDELRFPLFGQILGFDIRDTGFFKRWFSKREWKFFNSNEAEIKSATIIKEIKKTRGRRVFHPYRAELDKDTFPGIID